MRTHSVKWLAAASLACAAYAPQTGALAATDDALHNTKKLAAEGHAGLYRNGAFQVPMTTIHLIPPGPSALELAAELAGWRAQQSFQESIKHARESVDVAKAGVDKSVSAAASLNRAAGTAADEARAVTRFAGRMVASAPHTGGAIVGASVSYAKPAYESTRDLGAAVSSGALAAAGGLSETTDRAAWGTLSGSASAARAVSSGTAASSRRHASFAAERFVKGYAAAPSELGARASTVGEAASLDRFVSAYTRSSAWRSSASGWFSGVIVDTGSHYASDVGRAFGAARESLGRGEESGYTFAMLKSLRWVLQAVLWNATVKPVGKVAGASLAYLTVNAVAFPALITVREGAVVANLAAEVGWNSAGAVYDVTAPTATAAVAGLFSAVELVGGQAAAAGGLAAGTVASGGTYVAGKAAAGATAGGGYVAGKTVQYVAAPLSAAGVVSGGTVVGVVAGTGAAAAGAGLAVAGSAPEAGARTAGAGAAATLGAGGSAVSVAAGAALGTYELAKAVVVPAGYNLGAGIVLGYGTVTQLGAQTVLAVSDASYMVLSLEGPRWVLYAVKGSIDKGESIPVGTVLDLKAMQESGETFYAVPASEAEVTRAADAIYREMPTLPPAAAVETESRAGATSAGTGTEL